MHSTISILLLLSGLTSSHTSFASLTYFIFFRSLFSSFLNTFALLLLLDKFIFFRIFFPFESHSLVCCAQIQTQLSSRDFYSPLKLLIYFFFASQALPSSLLLLLLLQWLFLIQGWSPPCRVVCVCEHARGDLVVFIHEIILARGITEEKIFFFSFNFFFIFLARCARSNFFCCFLCLLFGEYKYTNY